MPLDPTIKRNLLNQNTWLRLAFMVLFVFIYTIVEVVIAGVVVLQFVSHLLTGTDNPILRVVGGFLGRFIYQMVLFLTYNTECKPFPFGGLSSDKRRRRRGRRR